MGVRRPETHREAQRAWSEIPASPACHWYFAGQSRSREKRDCPQGKPDSMSCVAGDPDRDQSPFLSLDLRVGVHRRSGGEIWYLRTRPSRSAPGRWTWCRCRLGPRTSKRVCSWISPVPRYHHHVFGADTAFTPRLYFTVLGSIPRQQLKCVCKYIPYRTVTYVRTYFMSAQPSSIAPLGTFAGQGGARRHPQLRAASRAALHESCVPQHFSRYQVYLDHCRISHILAPCRVLFRARQPGLGC